MPAKATLPKVLQLPLNENELMIFGLYLGFSEATLNGDMAHQLRFLGHLMAALDAPTGPNMEDMRTLHEKYYALFETIK